MRCCCCCCVSTCMHACISRTSALHSKLGCRSRQSHPDRTSCPSSGGGVPGGQVLETQPKEHLSWLCAARFYHVSTWKHVLVHNNSRDISLLPRGRAVNSYVGSHAQRTSSFISPCKPLHYYSISSALRPQLLLPTLIGIRGSLLYGGRRYLSLRDDT